MKKFFSCILLVALLLSISTTVYAENQSYYVSDFDLSIQLNDNWVVATKDSIPPASSYRGSDAVRNEVSTLLSSGKASLVASDLSTGNMIIIRSDSKLDDAVRNLKDTDTAKINLIYEVLRATKTTIISNVQKHQAKNIMFITLDGAPVSVFQNIQAVCMRNGKSATIVYMFKSDSITTESRALLKSVMDSATFGGEASPASKEESKPSSTPAKEEPKPSSKAESSKETASETKSTVESKEANATVSKDTSSTTSKEETVSTQTQVATKNNASQGDRSTLVIVLLLLMGVGIILVGIVVVVLILQKSRGF